ncbi:unnamed protein product [Meloidogyne enterolobii]|uniref:Uncharacterized protein n=2 Tax=Meloidogyne enterolobii TaxID=390850 RepID=A0ACB0ZM78_MELEN|nr:unnamed protein product [Meloidogyne enterolobii]
MRVFTFQLRLVRRQNLKSSFTTLREAWRITAETSIEAQEKMKEQYDKLQRTLEIKIGDRVLLRNYAGQKGTSKKFNLPWKGIYRVIEIEGLHVIITSCVSPQSNPKRVHINQIKKCFEDLGPNCTVPNIPSDEEVEFEKSGAREITNKPGYSHPSRPQSVHNEEETIQDKVEDKIKYSLRPREKILLPAKFRDG